MDFDIVLLLTEQEVIIINTFAITCFLRVQEFEICLLLCSVYNQFMVYLSKVQNNFCAFTWELIMKI